MHMENTIAIKPTEILIQAEELPSHCICTGGSILKNSSENWIVNLEIPYLLSNALQFNLYEEIPLIKGTFKNIEQTLRLILNEEGFDILSEINLFFIDCHLLVMKEKDQNIVDIIEDILSNLFQHLPHLCKHGDIIPDTVYIPMQNINSETSNSCFKKWGLYYPNESELIVYTLDEKSLHVVGQKRMIG